jgi:hypothetical protein
MPPGPMPMRRGLVQYIPTLAWVWLTAVLQHTRIIAAIIKGGFLPPIMKATQSTCDTVAQGAAPPSDSELPGGDPPVPDEASPLLHRRDSREPHPNTFGRWFFEFARPSASAFIDKNAGLLLVAASQFFFSAMGISVKWLNSLDEPVPTLQVCINSTRPIISLICHLHS